ncbi:RNA polymerase sigma factor [Algoriphagus litoralis]|uniref:RNA polymerase sigma factor n=1 Tax=Algoriphagus litoralis TaxID=2202829 RepID=UPI000DB9F76C|nr:sigma-70 family RNA polymerase sigma factor [Algoriphagus litoralis]
MSHSIEDHFIETINQHRGILHKVSGIFLKGFEEKEDLIQEMLFQLWKAFPGFSGNSKFSTWMYRVCLNTALTYSKKKSKSTFEELEEHHLQITTESGDLDQDRVRMLYEAIEMLSPLNRAIILLYLENQSYDEIAEITGLSRSNVSVRLVRAKKELEKKISTTNQY